MFDRIIRYTFIAFFFLLPLILTPFNYELFEFNKMLLTYTAATIIGALWLVKMIVIQRIEIRRTALDIPIILFFISQVVSTILSIDPHISIWGYYGRFNGGLLSIICYILLYYAAVTNLTAANVATLIKTILVSSIFVSIYAILQRAGIDKDLWVQDVQRRVFSTLGQPNWLAAYITAILPITMAMSLASSVKCQVSKFTRYKFYALCFMLYVLCSMFYAVLLFTDSRSGFLAFWITNCVFWLIAIALIQSNRNRVIAAAIAINLLFIGLSAVFNTPYQKINRQINMLLTFNKPAAQPPTAPSPDPAPTAQYSENVVTDSWVIRKTVWPAAIEAWKEKPLTGWGVETFAWVFYKFKPIAHNSTSEWDFLYNKAHNEYLNYLATTGAFGLGSYLAVIGVFSRWVVWQISKSEFLISNQIPNPKSKNSKIGALSCGAGSCFARGIRYSLGQLEIRLIRNLLVMGLSFGWLSLLITNFFGFSVVATAVLFWLIPAFIIALLLDGKPPKTICIPMLGTPWINRISLVFIAGIGIYGLFAISAIWMADYNYAKGVAASDANRYETAYDTLSVAARLRPNEPLFQSELATILSSLALSGFADGDLALAGRFTKEAIDASNAAIDISPQNLTNWKSRTRMFYALSQLDETYINNTLRSIAIAQSLAPTDAKIAYNLGIIYHAIGNTEEAIETLEQTMTLKPNYRNAAYALALFYEEAKKPQDAQKWYRYILEKIDPDDSEVKKKMKK